MEVETDVAGHAVEQRGCAGRDSLRGRGHDRQRLDVHFDRFGGVLGLQQGLGDHAGDRIADEAHLVGRQRRPRRLLQVGAVLALERQRRLQGAVLREVRAGVDRDHALHLLGGGGVDRLDPPVRHGRAQDEGMRLIRQVDVVGVAAFAAQQRGVFLARHRLADGIGGSGLGGVLNVHGVISPISPAFRGNKGRFEISDRVRFDKHSRRFWACPAGRPELRPPVRLFTLCLEVGLTAAPSSPAL